MSRLQIAGRVLVLFILFSLPLATWTAPQLLGQGSCPAPSPIPLEFLTHEERSLNSRTHLTICGFHSLLLSDCNSCQFYWKERERERIPIPITIPVRFPPAHYTNFISLSQHPTRFVRKSETNVIKNTKFRITGMVTGF